MKRVCFLWMLLLLLPPLAAQTLLDDFEQISSWQLIAADGVKISTSSCPGRNGNALRIDFDFVTGAGYCGVTRTLPKTLPENYGFAFYLQGTAPINNLEFKLVDAGGDNVWWYNQRNFEFPLEWTKIGIKKRHISFAWGPTNDRELKSFNRIEIIIASATGGKGFIVLDDLTFQELEPVGAALPQPIAIATTSADENHRVEMAIDNDIISQWRSAQASEAQEVVLDLGTVQEFGGLVIDWDRKDYARSFQVLTCSTHDVWDSVYQVTAGKGGRSYIPLKEAEARYIKLRLTASVRGQGYGIGNIAVKEMAFAAAPEAVYYEMAKDLPRGMLPKYFNREQSYWTLSGVNNDQREALINEEGMVEVDKSSFSIEPFVDCEQSSLVELSPNPQTEKIPIARQFYTWHDVSQQQSLEQEELPIPSVTWRHPDWQLEVRLFSAGDPGKSSLFLTYRLTNISDHDLDGRIYLAIRPFQVNPPWQFLNWPGGVSKIKAIQRQGQEIVVNDAKRVMMVTPCDGFGAATFDQGDITTFLAEGELPLQESVRDHLGYASAAMAYKYELRPGQSKRIDVMAPFYDRVDGKPPVSAREIERIHRQVRDFWSDKLRTVEFKLPEPRSLSPQDVSTTRAAMSVSPQTLIRTVHSNLAYILINRDGAGIQPGSRSYERSWIRDGSLTSAALLRLGVVDEVRDFLDWYSDYQFPNGKVPCVVDRRGPDPVPENDSHGQLIFALRQYYLFSHDRDFLERHFDHVQKAVAYMDELTAQRLTDYYRLGNDSLRALYGLMPESISHEGYSAKPMHSYWDDFFTLRGYGDAVEIAAILGREQERHKFIASRDRFRTNLYQSLELAIRNKAIDYIPGCAELGDFDATSTAIAVYPGNEWANLPQPQAQNTFDRYFDYFSRRLQPEFGWNDYTPYETRLIGAFVRIGQPQRAWALLEFFLGHQRPRGWNHWAEVVWKDATAPRFIGDMPHTWVGSDFINSVRTLFAYEDEHEQSLVLAAGIPAAWLDDPQGVAVEKLPTYYGRVSYRLKKQGSRLKMRISGDLTMPAGKIQMVIPAGFQEKEKKMPWNVARHAVIVDRLPMNIVLIEK